MKSCLVSGPPRENRAGFHEATLRNERALKQLNLLAAPADRRTGPTAQGYHYLGRPSAAAALTESCVSVLFVRGNGTGGSSVGSQSRSEKDVARIFDKIVLRSSHVPCVTVELDRLKNLAFEPVDASLCGEADFFAAPV